MSFPGPLKYHLMTNDAYTLRPQVYFFNNKFHALGNSVNKYNKDTWFISLLKIDIIFKCIYMKKIIIALYFIGYFYYTFFFKTLYVPQNNDTVKLSYRTVNSSDICCACVTGQCPYMSWQIVPVMHTIYWSLPLMLAQYYVPPVSFLPVNKKVQRKP